MPGTKGSTSGTGSGGFGGGSARTEAERLVATFLAMASQGGSGGGLGDMLSGALGHAATAAKVVRATAGWATGEPACCVCPLCRVINGLRDPSPQTVERLATGAGDFAAGVASLLRSLNEAGVARPPAAPRRPEPDADTVWRAATDHDPAGRPAGGGADDPWSAATTDAHDTALREAAEQAAEQAAERAAEQAAAKATERAAARETAAREAAAARGRARDAAAAVQAAVQAASEAAAAAAASAGLPGRQAVPSRDAGRDAGPAGDPWAAATRAPAARRRDTGQDDRERAGAEPAAGHDGGTGDDAR